IRTWDSGSKVRRLTTWPRPTGHGSNVRGGRWGLRPPRTPRRLLAAFYQFCDATPALAAELRINLATELGILRFAAFAADLGVSARPQLRLARLAAFAAVFRGTLGPELAFAGLAATTADLSNNG